MSRLLRYRGGPAALRVLRERGLSAETIGVVAGPASGPKWLVLAGIDRALMETGLVAGGDGLRPLLVGASAGAWRMLALASRDPGRAHRALLDGYIHQVFPPGVPPEQVTAAYRRMLDDVVHDGDAGHVVDHPAVDVAIHVCRARGPLPWRRGFVQTAVGAVTIALNAANRALTSIPFQRVLLHTSPGRFRERFGGKVVPLTRSNLRSAALATGSVPIYMEPVHDIGGAPRGAYLDGGITDCHLRQTYDGDPERITLFPHFQERNDPIWFDRYLKRPREVDGVLDNVLQVYPSPEFVASLPDRRLPDRDDFFRYEDDPEERFRRWNEAVAAGERLGEEFLRDLEAGRIVDHVESYSMDRNNPF